LGISGRSFDTVPLDGKRVDFFFLGDEELVTAFRFIGIDGMTVRNPEEASAVFKRITEGFNSDKTGNFTAKTYSEASGSDLPASFPGAENCRVLLLTEETADWLGDLMINWQLSGNYPLLVEVPGISGRLEGRKTLVDSIREAVGIHI